MYVEVIRSKGDPLDTCVGFINYTKHQMCHPGGAGENQRARYYGNKQCHCLVYQTVTTPDGLMFNLYGPEAGRRYDMTLYREEDLDRILKSALSIAETQYCL